MYDAKLNELLFDYDGCTRIFAVGSTILETAGAAAVLAPHNCNKRLPNHSSIFTAETHACDIVGLEDSTAQLQQPLLVFIDSLPCMQSMRERDMSRSLIAKVLCCTHKGKHLCFDSGNIEHYN